MKGNAWTHTPNDTYRERYDAMTWDSGKEEVLTRDEFIKYFEECIEEGLIEVVCEDEDDDPQKPPCMDDI